MLHVVLRSTARSNGKPRPPDFDKLSCLLSLVRAVREVEALGEAVELVHLHDGALDPAREQVARATGRVVERSLAVAQSYWAAVELVRDSAWPDGDLVYLAEDDHLHRPEALAALVRAAAARPQTGYFALYGCVDGSAPTGGPLPDALLPLPRAWRPSTTDVIVDGVHWRRALSCTSSFAVRVGQLRADARVHLVGHRTLGLEGAHDHPICLAVQGMPPFAWSRPVRRVLTADEPLERRVKHAVWDVVLNLLAVRRHRRPAELLGAVPALATHHEAGWLAEGTDWARLSREAAAWGRDQGLPPAVRPTS